MREDIEKLMAIHDGEQEAVAGGETDADKQALDPESQEFLARLKAADRAFAAAADEMLDMPIPSRLVDAIRKPQSGASTQAQAESTFEPEDRSQVPSQVPSEVGQASQQPRSAKVIPFPRRRRAVVSFALAAGLAAVVATNTQLFRSPTGPALKFESAGQRELFQDTMNLVASGDLQESADGFMSIMPVASFLAQTDAYCREFTAQQRKTEFSGIACRDAAGRWELLRAQVVGNTTDSGSYRLASGERSETAVPTEIVNADELSYSQEQAAIHAGWQD